MPGSGRKLWSVSSVLSPRLLLFSNSSWDPPPTNAKISGELPCSWLSASMWHDHLWSIEFQANGSTGGAGTSLRWASGFSNHGRSHGAAQQIAGRADRAQPQQRASNTAASEAPVNVGTARRWAARQRRLELRPIGAGCVVWHQIQL